MREFWNQQAQWSNKTFGSEIERGPKGPLLHLKKEVEEALIEVDKPCNVGYYSKKTKLKHEIVDCLFLVFDAARRSNLSYDEFMELAFFKLGINRQREWPRKEKDSTLPVEHDRSKE